MENNLLDTAGSSVYPGEYVPLFKENDLNKTVKYPYKNKASGLPANIEESGNSYKIELAISGVERENLFLKVCENVLSVSVIHNNEGLQNKINSNCMNLLLTAAFPIRSCCRIIHILYL